MSVARSFLRQVIDINPHFIFVKDREGRFTLVNEAVALAYGSTPEALVGKTDADTNGNREQVERFRRDDLEVMDSLREKFIAEEIITDASGNTRYLQTIKRPLVDSDGVARHVLGVSTDITAQRLAEEQRGQLQRQVLHAQKLESLGVLAGGIAHDFNNLLVGMLANVDLAAHILGCTSAAGGALEQIRIAARRAAELCRQMLTYTGQSQRDLEPVDVAALAEELHGLLRASVNKKAELGVEVLGHVPAIDADPGQIRQVLMNLIINGAEALHDRGGKVTVRVEARRCEREELADNYTKDELHAGDYVVVTVVDDGCGMDQSTMERIFDPFFSTKFSGRGLGLASALGIVRSHRGAVRVRSELAQGTEFNIYLPVSLRPSLPGEPHEAARGMQPPGRLLVVDDEPTVLFVVRELLQHAGHTVITATNGEEGLELLRQNRDEIQGVFLDLTMPRKGGVEVLHHLRKLGIDVPVYLMSGFDEKMTKAEFDELRVVGFLQKPFDAPQLMRAADSLLGAGSGS